MNRVSTQGMHQRSLSSILAQQSNLSDTQLQVGSGRRFQSPADNPVAATRELDLSRSLSRLEQLEQNLSVVNHRLGLEDNALGDMTNTLQRVRELALTVNTDTNDGSGGAIAAEADELLNHLVQLANSSDGEGGYLFSGFSAEGKPFAREGSDVTYRGDQGQRFIQIGPNRRIADGDSGAQVFQFVKNGNGTFTTSADSTNTGNAMVGVGAQTDASLWVQDSFRISFITDTDYEVTDSGGAVIASGVYDDSAVISFNGADVDITGTPLAGDSFQIQPSAYQDIFASLQQFVDVAGREPAGGAARAVYHSDINSVIANLDQALDHISTMRTRVGTRMSAVDSQSNLNADSKLSLQTTLSDVRDVDIVAAASQLDLQRVALQAAQQAFVKVQNLSLFRLL